VRKFASRFMTVLLIVAAFAFGIVVSRLPQQPETPGRATIPPTNTKRGISVQVVAQVPSVTASLTPSETLPPNTPLATLTPSRTLRPPPTFEPPTATLPPSETPTITPTSTIDLNVSVPGLRGAETATPSTTPGCVPRKEWKLIYKVQPNDALQRIADQFNTTVDELVAANCLRDANIIRVDQELRVPGETLPGEWTCFPIELVSPVSGTLAVPSTGFLSFVWIGPRTPRYLIEIRGPDGSEKKRIVIELRQNESVDLKDLPEGGTYTFTIHALDYSFREACITGGPWTFTKEQFVPTATPTSGGIGGVGP
jgi:LysM repeat protein